MTIRTLAPLGSHGLYLGGNVFHRHRRDAGCGDAVGDGEEAITRLAPPDRLGEQPVERLRCQQPRLVRGLGGGFGKLDLDSRQGASSLAVG
jgi:hypothetical protein